MTTDNGPKVSLRRVRINSQGYDAFGSYYGVGQPVWEVMVQGYASHPELEGQTITFRAADRDAAKAYARQPNACGSNVRFYR